MQIRHSGTFSKKFFYKYSYLQKTATSISIQYAQKCKNIRLQVFEAASLSAETTQEFGFLHCFYFFPLS